MRLAPPDLASFQYICRNLREKDRLEVQASEEDHDPDIMAGRMLAAWRACGVMGQVIGKDEPIAMMAVLWLTPRATSAGLLATDRWGEVARPYSRHVRRVVLPKLVEAGVRRIEARTWEHHDDSRRWLRWLGAVEECRIPQWGRNGETFIQYAWIPHVLHPEITETGRTGVGPAATAVDH